MIFTFHGGAQEVGRSCIELATETKRILFDAGLKITPNGTEYPKGLMDVANIDAVFISHAHLDHTGALPWLDFQGLKCPIFCTAETKTLARLLLKDAYHIGKIKNAHLSYDVENIQDVLRIMRRVKTKLDLDLDDLGFEFYNAGHIPGSASILLAFDDKGQKKSGLYTGDINTTETHLLKKADTDFDERVDVMITEATYGDRDHPARKKEEKRFRDEVQKHINRGNSILIPVFAVGRAQEVMLILSEMKLGVPIYVDGMARDATLFSLDNPGAIKDAKELRSTYRGCTEVRGRKQREAILKDNRQAIFLTTSGMLTGGPIISYLKKYHDTDRCAIFLTGYQATHTNGRLLMEENHVFLDGHKYNVRCCLNKFDFSAHSGCAELKELIRKVNPKHLIINHGDPKAIEHLALWAHALDYEVHTPKVGDSFEL